MKVITNYSAEQSKAYRHQHFSLLHDFTCDVTKDELEKHPEMRTIAMVELENNFPPDFSAKVLKCLPNDVAKLQLNPHTHINKNNSLVLPKESMVIYLADKVEWSEIFVHVATNFSSNFPVVHHLSKHLIVSSDLTKINKTVKVFEKLLNVVQIYEKNGKIIARSHNMIQNLTTLETFDGLHENLSQILFLDKAIKLNQINAVHEENALAFYSKDQIQAFKFNGSARPNCKWTPFIDILAEKFNAKVNFREIPLGEGDNWKKYRDDERNLMKNYIDNNELDFFLNYGTQTKLGFESYNIVDWCFLGPVPEPYSITELILFLPMDESCWMWLGITIAVSTLIWRVSEGHWGFAFGAFSYFMGQAQLSIRIKTKISKKNKRNRLTMKILLQLLILTFFIFSNGYQSLVTSFMLDPLRQNHLKTVDDVFESDVHIIEDWAFDDLHSDNPKYQKVKQEGRVIRLDGGQVHQLKLVAPQPCKTIKNRIEYWGDGKTWWGIYLVPEVIYSGGDDLFVLPFHPFRDKFQELMDRSFEAGLHQAWEGFYWIGWRVDSIEDSDLRRKQPEPDNEILDFGMIAPFFLILAVGSVASLLALWCEIFHRDVVAELSWEYFKKNFLDLFKTEIIEE